MLKTKTYFRLISTSLLILVFYSFLDALEPRTASAATHPFLIVKSSDYSALQSRSSQEPWKSWKAKAISDIGTLNYNPSDPVSTKISRMKSISSAGALAYILDPPNRASYVNKLKNTLNYWDDLYASRTGGWSYEVPNGTAFFNSVMALDIIYNDLSSSDRTAIENKLDKMAEWYWLDQPHPINSFGVRIAWALYQNDSVRLDTAKNDYRQEFIGHISNDGVGMVGSAYAQARLSGEREAKTNALDMLEFTGEDNAFYTNSKVIDFFEWVYGYSITPFGKSYSFGDTKPNRGFDGLGSPAFYRAYRFSSQAAKYAAWAIDGKPNNKGSLLHYVLAEQAMPSPEKPKSRIFWDGGAWFLEDNSSSNSLAGALWNPKSVFDAHAHKEVNAIYIGAYGEHIMRNSGYNDWGNGALGFTWDYINNQAVSGNTVLINGANHQKKFGGGIGEGFISNKFDYASGDSGTALVGGKHQRNFVFVHPQDGRNGYYLLFDEVSGASAGQAANVALHPNSDNYSPVLANTEYRFTIGPNPFTGNNVAVTVFLGTPPDTLSIKDGVLASDYNFVGKYLYSSYNTDSSGKKNIVTVLFPHDNTHAKASMSRITGSGYTGSSIDLGSSIIDTALESQGTSKLTNGSVSFQGKASWYRTNSGNVSGYFIRSGKSFDDGKASRQGFESNNNVSLHIKDKVGTITSPSASEVTFYYPGLNSVKIDNSPVSAISSGEGWMKVSVPSQTHTLAFNGAVAPTPAPTPVASITVTPTLDPSSTPIPTSTSSPTSTPAPTPSTPIPSGVPVTPPPSVPDVYTPPWDYGEFTNPLSFGSIPDLVGGITGWILGIVASVILLMMIIGGLIYTTSAGDEERMAWAKRIIIAALVGFVVIILAASLIEELRKIL